MSRVEQDSIVFARQKLLSAYYDLVDLQGSCAQATIESDHKAIGRSSTPAGLNLVADTLSYPTRYGGGRPLVYHPSRHLVISPLLPEDRSLQVLTPLEGVIMLALFESLPAAATYQVITDAFEASLGENRSNMYDYADRFRIQTHMRRLRLKIGEENQLGKKGVGRFRLIHTVHGEGYILSDSYPNVA